MKEKEVVKIGYKKLTLFRLDWVYMRYFKDYAVSDLEKERIKEKVKKKVKDEFVLYYLKDSLLQEPITGCDFMDYEDVDKRQYRLVKIPQKELETILLKNKLCGYLTFATIVQEQEFDKIFNELYQKLINNIKSPCKGIYF